VAHAVGEKKNFWAKGLKRVLGERKKRDRGGQVVRRKVAGEGIALRVEGTAGTEGGEVQREKMGGTNEGLSLRPTERAYECVWQRWGLLGDKK